MIMQKQTRIKFNTIFTDIIGANRQNLQADPQRQKPTSDWPSQDKTSSVIETVPFLTIMLCLQNEYHKVIMPMASV